MSDILCGGNGIRRCVSAFGAVGNKGRALLVPTGDLSILCPWKTITENHLLLFAILSHPNKGEKSVRAVLSHRYAKPTPALLVSDRVLINSSSQHSCKPHPHHASAHSLPIPLPFTRRSIHLMPPCNVRPRSCQCVSAEDKHQQRSERQCLRQCLRQCAAPIVSSSVHSLRRPHSRPYV